MTVPEFHRPFAAAAAASHPVTVEATPSECAALARRLQIPGVGRLCCRWHCTAEQDGEIAAIGVLEADLLQICVVTLQTFAVTLTQSFAVRFVPETTAADDEDLESEVDRIAYAGATIDLGEAAAEQLALSLDPYPRMPGAELPAAACEAPVHPLARLADWRGLN